MKKKKLNFKLIFQIIFFVHILNVGYTKNIDKFHEANNISKYFSGILSLTDNDYNKAYKNFKSLEGLESEHDAYKQLYYYSLINSQRFQEAYIFSKKLEKNNLDNFESNLIAGVYYLKNNNHKKASFYINQLKGDGPTMNLQVLLTQSLSNWISLKETTEINGLKLINSIPASFENMKKIQNALATCYFNSFQTETVFKQLTSGKKNNFSRYNFFYANYLNNQGKIQASKIVIEESIKRSPKNLIMRQFKEDLTKNKKDFSNQFDCQNLSHNIAEIFYILSNALAGQSAFKLSNFYLNLAKYLNPNFTSFETMLAQNFNSFGQLDKSKKIYREILKKGKVYKWYAAKQITYILIKQKKNKEAIDYLTKIYKNISSPSVSETFDFAAFLKNNELFDESIIYYSEVINSIDKKNIIYAEATDGRGVAYERIGSWNKAEKDLLASLEAKPKQPYVMNYLAYSWIEMGVNIDESLKLLKEANKIKINDGYITDSLGWVLFKLKEYDDAKKYLQLAVRLMPSDPIVNDHYGDSLWMKGFEIQARYYWNYVLNLKKTKKELKEKIKIKLISGLEL